jgi:hypothetical protein
MYHVRPDSTGDCEQPENAAGPPGRVPAIEVCQRQQIAGDPGGSKGGERLAVGPDHHVRDIPRWVQVRDCQQQGALCAAEKRRPGKEQDSSRHETSLSGRRQA